MTRATPGAAFRAALSAAGLSQRAAAAALDINERTVRRYAAGDLPTPRVVTLALERLRDIRRGRGSPAT